MAHWSQSVLIDAIRYAFVSCDDTGACGRVLEEPIGSAPAGAVLLIHQEEENSYQDHFAQSPDIQLEPAISRVRSSVSKKLDERKVQLASRVKTVAWKAPTSKAQIATDTVVFEEKATVVKNATKSLVSKLINETPNVAGNQFQAYAKFESAVSPGPPTKNFLIFLPGIDELNPPSMRISCLTTARVMDLVGVCCYRYTASGLMPKLSQNASDYRLYMADESGEIEFDLPHLSSTETVGRIGFTALALVQYVKTTSPKATLKHIVNVYFPSGECFPIDLDSLSLSLEELKEKALEKRRKLRESKGTYYHQTVIDYTMEKISEPYITLDCSCTVQSCACAEFLLIRENSSRGNFKAPSKKPSMQRQMTLPTESNLQIDAFKRRPSADGGSLPLKSYKSEMKSFSANLMHKLKLIPASITLHDVLLEITPMAEKKSKPSIFTWSPSVKQPIQIRMEKIGAAELLDEKIGRKSCRVAHNDTSTGEFKFVSVEGEQSTIIQLHSAINKVIDKMDSPSRNSYKTRRKGAAATMRWASYTASPSASGSDYE